MRASELVLVVHHRRVDGIIQRHFRNAPIEPGANDSEISSSQSNPEQSSRREHPRDGNPPEVKDEDSLPQRRKGRRSRHVYRASPGAPHTPARLNAVTGRQGHQHPCLPSLHAGPVPRTLSVPVDIKGNALLQFPSKERFPILLFSGQAFRSDKSDPARIIRDDDTHFETAYTGPPHRILRNVQNSAESTRFFPASDPTMASAGSGSTAFPAIFLCEESTPATMMCRAVNSHAQSGRGEPRQLLDGTREDCYSMKVTLLISFSVVSPARTLATALSRREVMPSSCAARLISDVGCLVDDHIANVVRKIEQFVNRGSAAITRAIAFQTARRLPRIRNPANFIRIQTRLHQVLPADDDTGLRQLAQIMRTSRWARMQFNAETKLYGSTPMFRNRPSTSTTLLAWTVVKTRWPVSAD